MSMRFNSPLRYPGGKSKLAKFVALLCEKNNISGHYVEPYAGGASVALYLLYNGHVKEITINDLDRSIYAFWHSVLNHNKRFCQKIRETDATISNWKKFKKIQLNKKKAPLFDLGFSTFFLNRTNHSGIIDGGIIGGVAQKGNYKIDCRFNKDELVKRIEKVGKFKKQIHLRNLDALKLIDKVREDGEGKNTIFYFDPPYYLRGPSLYMNHYVTDDHKKVSDAIKKIKNIRWIVSYDNHPAIKKLYLNCDKKEYLLLHTAREIREGKEILFFSPGLVVPKILNPTKV